MRSGYENGYKVITLSDCVAATSMEEHDNALRYDYPMFSQPMTSTEFIAAARLTCRASGPTSAYMLPGLRCQRQPPLSPVNRYTPSRCVAAFPHEGELPKDRHRRDGAAANAAPGRCCVCRTTRTLQQTAGFTPICRAARAYGILIGNLGVSFVSRSSGRLRSTGRASNRPTHEHT